MTQFKKNVVAGLGEIGKPILQLLSKQIITVGYDINKKLMDRKKFEKYIENKTSILHICIPLTPNHLQTRCQLQENDTESG